MDGEARRVEVLEGLAAAGPGAAALGGWASLRRVLLGTNSLAILDQLVVSATRFLTSIIVGRVCGPYELGDYTLAFNLYCLAACVLTCLISLPFTVYDHQVRGDDRRAYAGSALVHFAAFELAVLVVFGVATVVSAGYGWPELAPLMRVLTVALPLALVAEFARRFALARLDVAAALAIDVVMAVVQVGGLLALAGPGRLSAEAAFAAMGAGGAVAGLGWLARARGQFAVRRRRILPDARRNWRFGRWTVASQLILVARSTAVLWLLALLLDPASTGIFGACETLVRLSAPLLLAVTGVQFPRTARAYAAGDLAEVRRLARHAAGVLGAATAGVFFLFVGCGDLALATLYGPAYGAQGAVLSLLALAVVTDAVEIVASSGLMALDRAHVVCAINLAGTVLMLAVAAVLIPAWGVVGAAWASLLGRAVTAVVMWAAFARHTGRELEGRPT